MKFEWDETKRSSNIQKHGIDFKEAHEIFKNPIRINLDNRFDYGEVRYIGLGITQNNIVVIAFTESEEETIRVISIRKATKNERKIYEKFLSNRLGSNK